MKKMNDLTELKHIFVSSQTKLFAALAIITFMIAGCLHTQAQNNNLAASIDNLDKLTGCSEEQVIDAAISDNTFPTDDKSKIFFLYNVKTGLLLNAGGYWGTHVSLKEFGMPLWIHKDKDEYIHFAQNFDKTGASSEEGNYLEYENKGNESDPDQGVYVDRSYHNSDNNVVKRGWALEPVSGKPYIYKLYTYLYSGNSFNTETKYYLIAYANQGDVDKNCGGTAETSADYKTAKSDGSDEWKIITYKQIFELQENQSQTLTKSLDLTFRLQCPGFSRENGALSNWKAVKYGGEGNLRFGLEHYYKLTDDNGNINSSYKDDFSTTSKNHISSYTFPDGTDARTFKDCQDYERHCGKYYAADIKKAHGAIYQDITVTHGGAYVIECKGFSTTAKAKLFAVVVKKETGTDGKETVVNLPNSLHMTVLGQTNYMSNEEKTALHIEEQNMDYAAKEFYGNHKYISSVLVQVPEKGGTIRFGIEVGDHSEKKTGKGEYEDNEWTVFDDFRLLYASKTTDGDLILDEDRDELTYLNNEAENGCSNTYQHVTLHLNKTFKKDKWNGFILPVDLTRDQLTQAFGPNVRLAELHQVTDTEIQFKSINVTDQDNDAVVMHAFIPYIIFPTKHLELEQTPAYTALLTKTGSNMNAKDVHITVKKNHIDIPNVSLAIKSSTGSTVNINDLTNMNTTAWTTNSNTVVDAATGSPIVSSNNKMTAYGTFARTFAPTAEGTSGSYQITEETNEDFGKWVLKNKSAFIDGRDDLKGCYFFDQGNMYYSTNRPRGLRGFSIWFRPTTGNTRAAKTFIDGVCVSWGETTDINSIIYGDDSFGENASSNGQFVHGIYTLQGQFIGSDSSKLARLPSGIYLVNGKKVAVK
jgi:hypothetical protein|nr:hypothetical protein [uncultured Prevotella sp.]